MPGPELVHPAPIGARPPVLPGGDPVRTVPGCRGARARALRVVQLGRTGPAPPPAPRVPSRVPVWGVPPATLPGVGGGSARPVRVILCAGTGGDKKHFTGVDNHNAISPPCQGGCILSVPGVTVSAMNYRPNHRRCPRATALARHSASLTFKGRVTITDAAQLSALALAAGVSPLKAHRAVKADIAQQRAAMLARLKG